MESPTINGWVESASVTTPTSYGEIVATWTVPPAPTSNDGQIVYFFPGMQDIDNVVSIIQPVLGWNMDYSNISTWSISSWNCCPSNGNNYYSPFVAVNPGDVIQGTVQSDCGAGTESCSTWNITTADQTSSQSTTLSNSSSYSQTFNWAFGGVLEAYNVTQCSDYPPNGMVTFQNIALYDYNFNLISNPAWATTYWDPSGTPQCGYVGYVAPTQVTLDYAPTWVISTVAGNGTYGYSGDGGAATDAELASPTAVALDTGGNVYIADYGNSRIRMISASTGDISTVAGDGTPGYSGDGGAATSAELQYPIGVTVDSSGNIYIADTFNYLVRKVTASTGIITTVAGNGTSGYSGDGGAATSAELGYPISVAVDGSGNIYISDYTNQRVRKVTASTGIITTVAGNGTAGYSGDGGPATSAELYCPNGLALDSSGNIYIADMDNVRIRKVTVSTGTITTVAGNGTFGYSGDGGPATSAKLSYITGVATDSNNNLYIADLDNCRIREVTASTGDILTVAGDGTCGYAGDGGLAISAELGDPWSVTVSTTGIFYIADIGNYRIRMVVP